MSANDVAKAWLNFGRENIGMFWWGGDHVSTEHTAYLNLLRGMQPPASGSIETNGKELAEQIGGQIFIDTWGLLFLGKPAEAARHARMAATVSHDGDALEGANFIAAAIAAAYNHTEIQDVIFDALQYVDQSSLYYQVLVAVQEFHQKHPEDWYDCIRYLHEEWGYDKYGGVVHVIPNAGVCMMALLYGAGDYAKTIEIAAMAGWDTDCNAGNVGTILGVLNGLDGLPARFRRVTNDTYITSSVAGQLNIVDIPTFVGETARLSCRMNHEPLPTFLSHDYRLGDIYYDFLLPGATHGFRTDNAFKTELSGIEIDNKNVLGVLIDRMVVGDISHVYNKTYYRRADFSDERYKPTFAPQAYSGQQVDMKVFFEKWQGDDVLVRPYVRDDFSHRRYYAESVTLKADQWQTVTFVVPELNGSFADEVGFEITTNSPLSNRLFGRIDLGLFTVSGTPRYSIDFAKQAYEFLNVTPFAHNRGERSLDNGAMVLTSTDDQGCSAFSGSYYASDLTLACTFEPCYGNYQKLLFRARGIRQYYEIGFDGNNQITLSEVDFDHRKVLGQAQYSWQTGRRYQLQLIVADSECRFSVDGQEVLVVNNLDPHLAGMYGFKINHEGQAKIREIVINK
jgi:ADP-ribosylglycohydrolase